MLYKVRTRHLPLTDVLRRKETRFRKISSQKFNPTGEFFHDSAIQMQAFIAFAAQKIGIYENTSYLCSVRTFVFDYPGRIPHGVRLYRYCPFYREPSFNDCSLFLFVLHHEVLKIRLAKRKDHGDRCLTSCQVRGINTVPMIPRWLLL